MHIIESMRKGANKYPIFMSNMKTPADFRYVPPILKHWQRNKTQKVTPGGKLNSVKFKARLRGADGEILVRKRGFIQIQTRLKSHLTC